MLAVFATESSKTTGAPASLAEFLGCFLFYGGGAVGFGGPIVLAGYMQHVVVASIEKKYLPTRKK